MKKILFALLFWTSLTSLYAHPAKLALCSACHGQEGISPNPNWPHLAGQHASYLQKQLSEYKKGTTRYDASMTPLLTPLSEKELIELAHFYSKKPIPKNSFPKKYFTRGEKLYRSGDFSKRIVACISCHGPHGTGNKEAGFPVLAGQNASYTIAQLKAFKEKKRHNDVQAIMRIITAQMSQEDMEAIAYYLQGLH